MRSIFRSHFICLLLAGLTVLLMPALAHGNEPDERLNLYAGDPPGEPTLKEGEKVKEMRYHRGFHFDIHEPTIDVYHAKGDKRTKVAVVICPGGGYGAVATGVEGVPAAKWLQKNGITAVLLRYRLKPYRHPVQMMDVQRALQMTRAHAEKWDLDPERIGVMGFSAGGHLASTATVHHKAAQPKSKDPIERVSSRPDFSVLIYPVIAVSPPHAHMGSSRNLLGPEPSEELLDLMNTHKQINKQTPPTLLVHSKDDNEVPIKNSELFYEALQKNGIKSKMLAYKNGRHAYGLGRGDARAWPGECLKWFAKIGVLKSSDEPTAAAPLGTNKGGKQILPPNSRLVKFGKHTGFVALPKGVKAGEKVPWLWSVPVGYNLPGKHEKWMMDQCLANGIAVAGVDLGGDFGTPAGRAAMTAFHKEVTEKHGLTTKACMLARSYGGTQMYNWATEHPDSVACLAGVYPVCNLASYPGLKSAAGKYGMSLEQFTKELKNHNPIGRLAPLAKAKVPIYHNTGDVDTLVPGKDNTFLLAERYKALGGDITVTVFKGQGHNYWSGFFEDKDMAAFIIKHAKKAALPKVLVFGDSISGGYHKSLIKQLEGKAEVVKLGAVATYRINNEAWWHSNRKAKALDFGSAKACIADLERFERHLSETKYDVIHFNFGLNDIFRGRKGAWHNPVDQYARDLATIVTLLKSNGAKVIWASITPIPANAPHNPEGEELIYNAAAAKVMKKHNIPINDLHSVVTNWDGYAEWKKGNDVHFSGGVYKMLAEQIAAKIMEQLGSPGEAEKE